MTPEWIARVRPLTLAVGLVLFIGPSAPKAQSDRAHGRHEDSRAVSERKVGIAIGGGFRYSMGPVSAFAEARFHDIFGSKNSLDMIPVTAGVMF